MTTEETRKPFEHLSQEELMKKLRDILERTKSPHEGEAATASAMLQKFLTAYNLEVADLEEKGQAKSKVGEDKVSLGKAVYVWKWKLDLASELANHFYCVALTKGWDYGSVNGRAANSLTFIGRPENVESLKMLYTWLIDQIRRISAEERKTRHREDIHPMRWQMAFGEGIVPRLGQRLQEMRDELAASYEGTQALVIHHSAEANDYLEEHYGRRMDGQLTKAQREANEAWERRKEEKAALLAADPTAYYKKYPHEHPDEVARREAEAQKRRNRSRGARRAAANRARSWESDTKDWERESAYEAGDASASKVNLQPFLNPGQEVKQVG